MLLLWLGFVFVLGFFGEGDWRHIKEYQNVLLISNDFCKKKKKILKNKPIPIVHGYFLKTQRTTLLTAATQSPSLSTAKSVPSQGVVH